MTWVGGDLEVEDCRGDRRPTVVIVDTPISSHPWLPAVVVDRTPSVGDVPIGDHELVDAPIVDNFLLADLPAYAGHGTFMAGLVRQACPSARILGVPFFGADGVVCEWDLLDVLERLVLRQVRARHGREDGEIDVVCLSLGYYHEDPDDPDFDVMLTARLQALAMLGVVVVASAGNDATVRPCFPAAFAPGGPHDHESRADRAPLVAVGATNIDGTSALFSNDGPWVRAWRRGVSLLSTFPRVDAGSAPTVQVESPTGRMRASLDNDDFSSGFALWSGTSFAAPLFAGEVARHLDDTRLATSAPIRDVLATAWEVVASLTDLAVPE